MIPRCSENSTGLFRTRMMTFLGDARFIGRDASHPPPSDKIDSHLSRFVLFPMLWIFFGSAYSCTLSLLCCRRVPRCGFCGKKMRSTGDRTCPHCVAHTHTSTKSRWSQRMNYISVCHLFHFKRMQHFFPHSTHHTTHFLLMFVVIIAPHCTRMGKASLASGGDYKIITCTEDKRSIHHQYVPLTALVSLTVFICAAHTCYFVLPPAILGLCFGFGSDV